MQKQQKIKEQNMGKSFITCCNVVVFIYEGQWK